MKHPYSLAVFTSMRSEYGLLKPLIKLLFSDANFKPLLLVGGGHLSHDFGYTINEIKADGFEIFREFPFLKSKESSNFLGESLAQLQMQMSSFLKEQKPDLLLFLGDRIELLPVATSALISSVPMAHISGGETTEGAIDNQIRHALTKLSHIHFPSTETYKKNLLQMGEEDWRICVSGEPGLDDVKSLSYIHKQELFDLLQIPTNKKVICTTFHPETIDNKITPSFLKNLFSQMLTDKNLFFLTTASSFDSGGPEINEFFENLARKFPEQVSFIHSLGKLRYYSLLKYADLMLGNSSSGLVEAQSFNLPVLNIGKRQKGRLANLNVCSVDSNYEEIQKSFNYTLSQEFKDQFWNKPNIYGDGNASSRIVNFIKSLDKQTLIQKKDVFQ